MADVPLPFGKLVLDKLDQAIEKHPLTFQSVYARYSALGDRSVTAFAQNNSWHRWEASYHIHYQRREMLIPPRW